MPVMGRIGPPPAPPLPPPPRPPLPPVPALLLALLALPVLPAPPAPALPDSTPEPMPTVSDERAPQPDAVKATRTISASRVRMPALRSAMISQRALQPPPRPSLGSRAAHEACRLRTHGPCYTPSRRPPRCHGRRGTQRPRRSLA